MKHSKQSLPEDGHRKIIPANMKCNLQNLQFVSNLLYICHHRIIRAVHMYTATRNDFRPIRDGRLSNEAMAMIFATNLLQYRNPKHDLLNKCLGRQSLLKNNYLKFSSKELLLRFFLLSTSLWLALHFAMCFGWVFKHRRS